MKESRQKMVEELNKKILEEEEYKSLEEIEDEISDDQKRILFINNSINMVANAESKFPLMVNWHLHGTTRDVTMWVGKREVEQEQTKKKWKLLKRWEKQKSAEKKERHYFRVSVQDIDTDVLVSSFLIFGTREEIMEYIKKEDVEKEILEQIMELSESVDE